MEHLKGVLMTAATCIVVMAIVNRIAATRKIVATDVVPSAGT
jgi:hypothetical protein